MNNKLIAGNAHQAAIFKGIVNKSKKKYIQ